jgi:hypothetical protein
MVTYTTTYNFAKPTVGDDEDLWGGYLNGNFDTLESLLKGTTALTAIDVTGNITVGGTVDGRDIAVNIPASLGTAGQVLTVNSGATAAEWADAGGGNTFDTEIIFEGSTADAFETTLTVTDPTADRTFTLPDATGTAAIIDAAGVLENESHTATLKLNSTNSGESRVELKTFQFGAYGFDLWDFEVDPSNTENNTILNFKVDGETIAVMSGTDYSGEKTLSVTNLGVAGDIILEGSTSDAFETTLTVTDPTADRTITLPDATGNVAVFSTAPAAAIADGTSGQVLTTNGSGVLSFADAGGGAYVLQSTTEITVNATASVDFTFATGSNILAHRFVLNRISGTAEGYEYIIQFRDQATSTFLTGVSDYEFHLLWQRSTITSATVNSDAAHDGIRFCINGGIDTYEKSLNGYIDVFNPYDTIYQTCQFQTSAVNNGGDAQQFYGGGFLNRNAGTGAPVDQIRFKPEGSGTFAATGSITYYTLEK